VASAGARQRSCRRPYHPSASLLLESRLTMKANAGHGTNGEASGPSEFKKAYANDESRTHLLWEHEVASSSLAAPTSRSANGQI